MLQVQLHFRAAFFRLPVKFRYGHHLYLVVRYPKLKFRRRQEQEQEAKKRTTYINDDSDYYSNGESLVFSMTDSEESFVSAPPPYSEKKNK
jgi:hypothetical protein